MKFTIAIAILIGSVGAASAGPLATALAVAILPAGAGAAAIGAVSSLIVAAGTFVGFHFKRNRQ